MVNNKKKVSYFKSVGRRVINRMKFFFAKVLCAEKLIRGKSFIAGKNCSFILFRLERRKTRMKDAFNGDSRARFDAKKSCDL